ncbi:hypothetical protein A0H76_866 [Hepatospora eriocheir]|uniref:Uncharacterized protein n=1 Tax=Hepatospora eriocheir TaxID=1081669 RepID=A0A1X0QKZ4_9MICR|nr:hypothetical protein A0H76_866 [Hepatospora eriocheir]
MILIELYEIIIEIFESICIKNNIKEFDNFIEEKMSEFSPENIEEMQDFIIKQDNSNIDIEKFKKSWDLILYFYRKAYVIIYYLSNL